MGKRGECVWRGDGEIIRVCNAGSQKYRRFPL